MSEYVYRSAEQRRVARIIPDLIAARELLRDIVWRELRARYRYATLGFLWTVLEPLALTAVLYFVFTYVFGARLASLGAGEAAAPEAANHYAVVLLSGLIFWQYFATALNAAAQSLINNHNLVTKVNFTREVIPISAVIFPLVNLGIGFVLLLGVHARFGGAFGFALLWIPVLFLLQFTLALGLGLLLACGQVLYRDVGHLVGVALTFGFYATPVFYELKYVTGLEQFPAWAKMLYLANPMAELITAYRQVLFELRFPDPWLLAWPAVAALLSLAAGVILFRRCAPTLSDHL